MMREEKVKQYMEITSFDQQFEIKIFIADRIARICREIEDFQYPNKIKDLFGQFIRRGKFKHLQYSYLKKQQTFIVNINKQYYFNTLNHKQYEIAMISRHITTILDQFSEQIKFFIKTVGFMKNFEKTIEIIKIDLISITISKQIKFTNLQNKTMLRKFFIRQSCFQTRSNFSYRPRQQQHLFSIFYEDFEENQSRDLIDLTIPTDQEYYQCPRLNFVDDLHTNDSLLRRFHYRFMNFYQAFSLYNHKVKFHSNKYVRQFYRKCINQSYFVAMRMKKMGFIFSLKRLIREKQSYDREKTLKISLHLYFQDQPMKYTDQKMEPYITPQNNYSMETFYPELSDRSLNQAFLKRLRNIQNQEDRGGFTPEESSEVIQKNSVSKRIIRPVNQATFCKVLTQFTFFLDRIFFKLLEVRQKKKTTTIDHQTLSIQAGEDLILRLPTSQQFSISQSKFNHHFTVQIKSSYSKKNYDALSKKQTRDFYSYENQINEIKMVRKKKANQDEPEKEHEFFQKHPSDFRGLKLYLNSLLTCWNAREIYQQLTDFISAYLNIVVEKLKDRVMLKNIGKWSILISSMQALIQSLTQSLNTETTTCKLCILQGFEDNKDGSQPGFITDLVDNDCVMTLTFSLLELTRSGWKPIIPFCAYIFKVYKSSIWLMSTDGEKFFSFSLDSTKKKMQTLLKQLLRKIHKDEITIPPTFYE